MCGCLSCTPYWGPRNMPRLGIEPVACWFTGWHSIHRATPAKAVLRFFINKQTNRYYLLQKYQKYKKEPYVHLEIVGPTLLRESELNVMHQSGLIREAVPHSSLVR